MTVVRKISPADVLQVQHNLREALTVLKGLQYLLLPRQVRAAVEAAVRILTKCLDLVEQQ